MTLIAIVCLDDTGGMLFNKRRQSRDRVVTEKILDMTKGKKLYMNAYSYKLFENTENSAIVTENYVKEAKAADYCFIETADPAAFAGSVDGLILFRWNRVYPAELRCTLDLKPYTLTHTEDFIGNSHEKITMEVYTK